MSFFMYVVIYLVVSFFISQCVALFVYVVRSLFLYVFVFCLYGLI